MPGMREKTDVACWTGSRRVRQITWLRAGPLLLLQSALCGVDKTAAILEEFGMLVEVSARASVPFGPVMTGRRMMLESRGLITADQDTEQLVIIRATK